MIHLKFKTEPVNSLDNSIKGYEKLNTSICSISSHLSFQFLFFPSPLCFHLAIIRQWMAEELHLDCTPKKLCKHARFGSATRQCFFCSVWIHTEGWVVSRQTITGQCTESGFLLASYGFKAKYDAVTVCRCVQKTN